jgi:hypothetical protein
LVFGCGGGLVAGRPLENPPWAVPARMMLTAVNTTDRHPAASRTSAGSRDCRIAEAGRSRYVDAMTPEIDPKLLNDPLFKELMAEGLAMQNRFSAEPVYAKTGKGHLKSVGVKELQRIKKAQKKGRG